LLQVEGLEKKFKLEKSPNKNELFKRKRDTREKNGWFHAVTGVNFSCAPGQVLGLIGANGAGKTTSLRLLATSLKPDGGTVRLDGQDMAKSPLKMRSKIGFLSGSTGLYHRLTVKENVEYFGRLYGMSNNSLREAIDKMFSLLDMASFADKRPDMLSTGMKQKASIARAIIHDPELLVLDEPTTGLDVLSAETILSFIESYKVNGVPIIFSTHHLHEVERLCDRVALIDRGVSKFNGTLSKFKSLGNGSDLRTTFIKLVNQD
jgi:sodium transport system ATP-binding protein